MDFGLGFDFGDLFAAGAEASVKKEAPKKAEKKVEKKAEGKKSADKKPAKKTGGKKEATDVDVAMPVTVLARGFKYELGSLGNIKMSDLLTKLDELGYHEVRQPSVSAVYDHMMNRIYLTCGPDAACEEDVQVAIDQPVIISDGQVKCELTLDNFEGYEADEVSVAELLDYWTSVNPNYAGCRLAYAGQYAYPVFEKYLESKTEVSFPCVIEMNGEEKEYGEEDFEDTTVAGILQKLTGNSNGVVEAKLVANLDRTRYFVTYQDLKNTRNKKNFEERSQKGGATVEKRYKLPLKVFIASFNLQEELTPEHFSGKNKVTLDEIKGYYAERYRIFQDTSRQLDTIYLEEDNMLSMMFISGKKGAYMGTEIREKFGTHELLRTISEFKEALKKPFFQGTLVSREVSSSVRVENLPHGIFTAKIDSERGTLSELTFERKLPKIPMSILVDIVAFFREDLTKEAWCKVLYDTETKTYSIFKGKQTASKAMVTYAMDSLAELYANGEGQKLIQVMEIHSHNVMPAYFSSVDDADEIYPGLFGVVGMLNEEIPQFRFRAGMEGVFQELDGKELFTLEGRS